MDKIKGLIGHFLEHSPNKEDMSAARLTKMVYLADWKSCLAEHGPITPIRWVFNLYGPYTDDVISEARSDPSHFEVVSTRTFMGNPKQLIVSKASLGNRLLSESEKAVAQFVIKKTEKLNWTEFIRLVYSTYPVVSQPRFSELDLPVLAREYKLSENGPTESTALP